MRIARNEILRKAAHAADPTKEDQVCTNGEITGGSIWVDLKEGVVYTIDGVEVTTATTSAEPGEHTVKATAAKGYVLSGDHEWTWTITSPPQ